MSCSCAWLQLSSLPPLGETHARSAALEGASLRILGGATPYRFFNRLTGLGRTEQQLGAPRSLKQNSRASSETRLCHSVKWKAKSPVTRRASPGILTTEETLVSD